MCTRPIRTVSSIAALLVLILLHGSCRRDDPAAGQASPSPVTTSAAARSAGNMDLLGRGDVPWWSEGPPWYHELSPARRAAIDEADRLQKAALEAWRRGELDRAQKGLVEVQRLYVETLGNDHWKTWDCQHNQALIRAEQQWTQREKDQARELRLEHLSDEGCGNVFWDAVDAAPADRVRSLQIVDDTCNLLKASVGPQYDALAEAYRHFYRAEIARECRDYAQAEKHFQESLRLLDEASPSAFPTKAYVHQQLSDVLLWQHWMGAPLSPGKQRAAVEHVHTALEMLNKWVPVDSYWIDALQTAGRWLREQGKYGLAQVAFFRAATACQRLAPDARDDLTSLLLDLAETCNAVGEGQRSLSILDYIDGNIRDALEDGKMTRYHTERGFAHLRQGEYGLACQDFQSALGMWVDAEGRDRGRVHYFYGAALTKCERFAEAIDQYKAAAKVTTNERTRTQAQLFEARARIFELARQGDLGGLREQVDALGRLEGELGPAGEARRYRLLAYAELELDQPREAMDSLRSSARWYERARAAGQFFPLDLGPWHENESPYLLGAICALRLRDWETAFEWLERHSGQALDALTQAAGQDTADWQDFLNGIAPTDENLSLGTQPDPPDVSDVLLPVESVTISELKESLLTDEGGNSRTAILGWVDDMPEAGRRRLPDRWVFVVRERDGKASLSFAQLDGEAVRPQDVISSITHPGSRPKWDNLAYRLYRQRVAPVREELAGIDRLYVLSRGALLGFPLEVLPVEEPEPGHRPQLLGDGFTVAYGPSCAVLRRLSARQAPLSGGAGRVLALGGVQSEEAPLPASGVEAATVAYYFGPRATVLLGHHASERALQKANTSHEPDVALVDYSHLHFAVHGEASLSSPERCYLRLTGELRAPSPWPAFAAEAYRDDGALSFREIMKLKLGASLVVLSACDSGLGRPLESEGYMGLPHAFFHARARAVVITLWPVEDVSAAILMDRFYMHLIQEKKGVAEALRAAKQDLRRQTWKDVIDWCVQHGAEKLAASYLRNDDLAYDQPKFWASYVLEGPHE